MVLFGQFLTIYPVVTLRKKTNCASTFLLKLHTQMLVDSFKRGLGRFPTRSGLRSPMSSCSAEKGLCSGKVLGGRVTQRKWPEILLSTFTCTVTLDFIHLRLHHLMHTICLLKKKKKRHFLVEWKKKFFCLFVVVVVFLSYFYSFTYYGPPPLGSLCANISSLKLCLLSASGSQSCGN